MNEFIHTLSAVIYLTKSQIESMADTYDQETDNNKIWFYNSTEKKLIFSKYADRGFRMEVDYTPYVEKKYHKNHGEYKAKWFVTPAKLLYPGQPMMKLFTPIEYIEACGKLSNIIDEIKADSGIDLMNDAKLHRIDVSKDIETPSEEYSQEVICIAKKALHKYGYELWTPTEEDVIENGRQEENSVMFCNHNQDVKSKIYNKMEDIKNSAMIPRI